MTEATTILKGRVLCYALFDLGDELHLGEAERLLTGPRDGAPAQAPRRFRLSREEGQTLRMKDPPLDVDLGRCAIELHGGLGRCEGQTWVRLFDHGSASVRVELAIPPGTSLERLATVTRELQRSASIQAEAQAALDLLLPRIRPALEGVAAWDELETYVVVFAEELSGSPRAEELLEREAPALWRLLVGEPGKRPSPAELEEMRGQRFSYLDDDLALIGWECAFVLEPDGTRDVPDVLEFARAQLVGLYSYDRQMDRELSRIYDEIEAERGARALMWSPFGRLARRVQERWIDFTEFTDRIENSVKVVGDLYLARVFRGALERYRVGEWEASVRRKQAQIAQVYAMLKADIEHRRSLTLEAMIVLLIVFEIGMALLERAR